LKNAYERSKIPHDLCFEILNAHSNERRWHPKVDVWLRN
jgi:hypothetical protein